VLYQLSYGPTDYKYNNWNPVIFILKI